jgi:hypothetical protein
MGSAKGAIRIAAKRLRLTESGYREMADAGFKWCHACRDWHRLARFCFARDRPDRRRAVCMTADNQRRKRRW